MIPVTFRAHNHGAYALLSLKICTNRHLPPHQTAPKQSAMARYIVYHNVSSKLMSAIKRLHWFITQKATKPVIKLASSHLIIRRFLLFCSSAFRSITEHRTQSTEHHFEPLAVLHQSCNTPNTHTQREKRWRERGTDFYVCLFFVYF